MGITSIATAFSIFLAGILPAGCHKNSAQQKPAATGKVTSATAGVARHDLGEISLTNHCETCVRLGGGKDCILNPKLLDGRNVQITLALESKGNGGKLHGLSVARVITRSGQPVDIAVGDFHLTLIPKIAAE